MTEKEIINKIKPILEELSYPSAVAYLTLNDKKWLKATIKALEQEPMVEIDLDYVIKQKYIEREVLDKIRAEIMSLTDGDTPERIWNVDVLEIIDKYRKEQEE